MDRTFDVAVVGATGLEGETLLELLDERRFPIGTVHVLGDEESVGERVRLGGRELKVEFLGPFDFSRVQIAFFSAGSEVSAEYAPRAAAAGCLVIDDTACFRNEPDVPLVVPEVNPEALAGFRGRNIVANPNGSTIAMLVALKPIYDAVGIDRINIATYQAVSGTGREAVEELARQTAQLLNGRPVETGVYPKQIAFNLIPHIDVFLDNGYTREEMKILWETRKVLGDDRIRVNATTVRVPVFFGHSAVVNVETGHKITAAEARKLLSKAPGVKVLDKHQPGGYPTPVSEAVGNDFVHVGRIREDVSHRRGLDLWIVADNVRKGGALNCVQIAEFLVKEYL